MRAQSIPQIILLSGLLACGSHDTPRAYLAASDTGGAPVLMQMAAAELLPSAPSLQSMWGEQKLIRSAELRMQVDKVPGAIHVADSIAKAHDALLADIKVNQDEKGRRSAQLVIRVPAPRFAETLDALKRLGEVKTEAVTTEDVTKAYADLETRLSVKEETASRLRALLVNRTGKLSDILDVERELSRVITEIEQMKGERRYYDQRIAISSISVTLFEAGALFQPVVGTPIRSAFRSSLGVLATSVSWLIYLVTFLIPWMLLATALWWITKRIKARRRAA